jgi:hypothetical protein
MTNAQENHEQGSKSLFRIEIDQVKSIKIYDNFINTNKNTQLKIFNEHTQPENKPIGHIEESSNFKSTLAALILIIYTGTGLFNAYSYNATTHVLDVYNSVANVGDADAYDFILTWYLSTDITISTNDYVVTSTAWIGLSYGYYISGNSTVDLDDVINLLSGTYYIGVYVDDLNHITESNENNNAGYFTT